MSEESQDQPTDQTTGQSTEQDSLLGTDTALADGEYYLSEGVKGVGEKPEWFDSNRFKSVDQQAKSYLELEKKFGAFTGSPKDGYNLPEGVSGDDELAKAYIEYATESNMNQDRFEKGFEILSAAMQANQEINQEAELSKLGDNAAQRIQQLEVALQNKLGESYEDIKGLVTTADSIKLAEKLMEAYAPAKLPIDGGDNPNGLTWEYIESQMFKKDDNGRLLRSSDPNHNAKVERLLKEFGGDKTTRLAVG